MEHQDKRPSAPMTTVQPTVMQILSDEAGRDSALARWSMAAAVAAHLAFFVLNWNFFAFGGDAEAVEQTTGPIYVVQQVNFEPPPKRDLPRINKPETRTVPVPDPDPNDPEPMIKEVHEEVVYVEPSDFIAFTPEPPPIETQQTIRWHKGGDLSEPRRVGGRDPVFPNLAAKVGKQGVVVLECVIGRGGAVKDVTVLRGLPLGLTEAAVDAVRTWVFEPSRMGGEPVEVLYVLTVNFRLQ